MYLKYKSNMKKLKNEAMEIYQPQIVTGDCVRCHTDWKEGEIGGYTHFRFSTKALLAAEKQGQEIISNMKKTSLRNSLNQLFEIHQLGSLKLKEIR